MEIDETVICRPKYNRGKMIAEQRWYFGGIEKMTGRCFMKELEKRDAATLRFYKNLCILVFVYDIKIKK